MEDIARPARAPRSVPLRRLLLTRFGAVIVLVIVSLGVIFGASAILDQKSEAFSDLETSAAITARVIDSFINEHRRAVSTLAAFISIGPTSTAQLETFHESFPSFLTVILVDPSGTIVAGQPELTSDGRPVKGIDVSDRDYFRVAMNERRPYLSEVFRGRGFGNDTIVAMSAPVVRDGELAAVVECSLNLGSFERFESYLERAENVSLIVLDSANRVVYSSWDELVPLSSLNDHPLLSNPTGEIFDYDAEGHGLQVGFTRRTGNGWTVIVTEPAENINRHVRASLLFTILWTVLALSLAVFVSQRLATRVTQPLEKLAAAVRRVTAGDRFVLPSDGRVTPAEINTLVDDFETMIARLEKSRLELESARDLALEGNRAKSAFLSRMSHELRTPLNAILGFAGVIESRLTHDDATLEDHVRHISQAGHQLLGIVEEILEIAQFQPDETKLHLEECDADRMIRKTIQDYRTAIEGKGNQLELDLQCDTTIVTDRQRVESMLGHLLSNANKFTDGGLVRVSAAITGGFLQIVVEDTGVGFDDSQVPQMFNPFWQADESSGRRYEGTGLGLAIIQRHCELLGASIQAQGSRGRGAKFTLRVPIDVRPSQPDL